MELQTISSQPRFSTNKALKISNNADIHAKNLLQRSGKQSSPQQSQVIFRIGEYSLNVQKALQSYREYDFNHYNESLELLMGVDIFV